MVKFAEASLASLWLSIIRGSPGEFGGGFVRLIRKIGEGKVQGAIQLVSIVSRILNTMRLVRHYGS